MRESSEKSVLKEQGNYLITGGMGELGQVFARYLAEHTRGTVILAGRRKADDAIGQKLAALREINAKAAYLSCDIASRESVEEMAAQVHALCGHLDGIIHAAGVHEDAFFIKKEEKDFERVLSVKVEGTRWLDEVFAREPLSFFVLFSSISAVFGNVGQTDYSYANACMDAYAEMREELRKKGLRSGRTISINWPLWDRGMSMDKSARAAVEKQIGVLYEAEGISAFEEALRQPNSRFIVLKKKGDNGSGVPAKAQEAPAEAAPKGTDQAPAAELEDKLKAFLRKVLSAQTGIPENQIRDHESFESYGIDSVMIMAITGQLEEKLGQLSKTLFFEYENIGVLSRFLASAKRAEAERLFGMDHPAPKAETAKKPEPVPAAPAKSWFTDAPAAEPQREAREEDPIAIIGLSGRYPQAENLDQFWENLKNGKDCITEIPAHRWHHELYDDPQKGKPGKAYSKWGGFIDDVEMFDPMFFKIPPIEAEFSDPHERLMLEAVWSALEDAGYTPERLAEEKVGVYTGAMYTNHQLYISNQYGAGITGNAQLSSIANRISYLLDMKGPSISLDTMCSSALTALCLACENIRRNLSTMAVVGGVNLSLHPEKYNKLCLQGFLSTDGRCRSFGEGGDGYVPGEGVGAVIIKPLSRAEKDGDHIYGVIRGIRMNAGGKTNGYTVPSVSAQRNLILDTLNDAHIDPGTISTVEAHGTGTALGDPIEVEALTQAYGKYNVPAGHCSIGSVKSNIGHLEAASGMAALTKVLLEMRHGQLAPTLHSEKPNPFIPFDRSPFYLQHELADWTRFTEAGREIPRRAAISTFGAGGSNVHMIVEEYRDQRQAREEDAPQLFVLSARNEKQLKAYAREMMDFLSARAPKTSAAPVPEGPKKPDPVPGVLADVLSIPQSAIGERDSLMDIGVDRYNAGEIAQKLSELTGINIADGDVLRCGTVANLSALAAPKEEAAPQIMRAEADGPSLRQIAYTLQTGRRAMEQRLAVVAGDRETLIATLKAYLDGEEKPNYVTGNTSELKGRLEKVFADRGFQTYLINRLKQGDLNEAAEFFVSGAEIAWDEVYGENRPVKASLPTYPFARERCWILPDDGSGCLCPAPLALSAVPQTIPAGDTKNAVTASVEPASPSAGPNELLHRAVDWVGGAFSAVLKIPEEEIDENRSFDAYGIDSIHIERLNHYLAASIADLPSTLFFSCKSIRQVAQYLVKEHPLAMTRAVGGGEALQAPQTPVITPAPAQAEEAQAVPDDEDGGIAIIGISGRYPQAESLEAFFENLRAGKDCIEEIPKERWDHAEYPEIKCKWGGFIRGADQFDPQFFGIAPYMAYFMDPQERLFLEAVWSCMEDAGYTPAAMENPNDADRRGRVAVYAGVSFNEYGLYGAGEIAQGKTTSLNSQIYSVANRVSYLFNFGGPSLSVDTACSSSLYALHMACTSILCGDADMAIAGGVNLSLHPSKYITLDWGKFLSSDGHCHTFGKDGDGYVPGEGVGAVLLRPLKDARKNHDHIYAVIRGTAVNHGGRTYGYSVPNPVAQSEVIDRALKKSGVDPRTISYVEAHGTGTALGDPIEVNALTDTYRRYTKDEQFCAIGSVKSNIGHLEAAAGISQVTKVILQMQHRQLVPSRLNADGLNPNLSFDKSPFHVQMRAESWNRPVIGGREYPRRAGVSSFGVGGVNVHVIMEEAAEEAAKRPPMRGKVVVPCSGRTEEALDRNLNLLLDFIRKSESLPDLRDLAYTLTVGRVGQMFRAAFVAGSYRELEEKLLAALNRSPAEGVYTGKAADAAWQDAEQTPEARAAAWVKGAPLAFACEPETYVPYRVSLPTYSFEKETYWMYSKKRGVIAEEESKQAPEEKADAGVLSLLKNAYPAERKGILVDFLQRVFAGILGFGEGQLPDPDEGFFSMGLESIMTRQALQIIEEHLSLTIEDQDLFNYPNIGKLAGFLLEMLNTDKTEAQAEIGKTFLLEKQWSEAESLRFTGSLGRGSVAVIGAGEAVEAALRGKLSANVMNAVCLYETPAAFAGEMGRTFDKVALFTAAPADNALTESEQALETVLRACLSGEGSKLSFAHFYAIPRDGQDAVAVSARGLLKALAAEYGGFHFKNVGFVPEEQSPEQLAEIIANEVRTGCNGQDIRYLGGIRQMSALIPAEAAEAAALQPEGVWLLAGESAEAKARIAAALQKAGSLTLIDLGKEACGAEGIVSLSADIQRTDAVQKQLNRIRKSYGPIRGVVYCPKYAEEAHAFSEQISLPADFAAAVSGAVCLDALTGGDPLALFMIVSPVYAETGCAGYGLQGLAASCLNDFMQRRASLANAGKRSGLSRALCVLTEGMGKAAAKALATQGLKPLDDAAWADVLDRAMASEADTLLALYGEAGKLRAAFDLEDEEASGEEPPERSLDDYSQSELEELLKREMGME